MLTTHSDFQKHAKGVEHQTHLHAGPIMCFQCKSFVPVAQFIIKLSFPQGLIHVHVHVS